MTFVRRCFVSRRSRPMSQVRRIRDVSCHVIPATSAPVQLHCTLHLVSFENLHTIINVRCNQTKTTRLYFYDNLYSLSADRASKNIKELNYILTRVDANIDSNFNVRRLMYHFVIQS